MPPKTKDAPPAADALDVSSEMIDEFEDGFDDRMGALFGDDPGERVEEPEATEDAETEETEEEPESEETEEEPEETEESQEDEEEDPDKEIDFDEPVTPPKKEEEAEIPNETMARKLAKENGRKVKELDTRLKERELELDRVRQELEEREARLTELQQTGFKPQDHPDFKTLENEIRSDYEQAFELIPNGENLSAGFGKFLADYQKLGTLEGEERRGALQNLKERIVERSGRFADPYADLLEDEKKEADALALDVLRVVQRNSTKFTKLNETFERLTEQAKSGQLALGEKEYQRTVAEFSPAIEAVGDLPDDAVEADPHAIESAVARLAKENPEYAKRLKQAKRDVLELLAGPRVLTQADLDKLKANGTDPKAFNAQRIKAHREKKQKLAVMLVQGLVTRPLFKEMSEKLAALESKAKEEEDEEEVIQKVTKKTSKSPSKKEEYIPVSKRRSSLKTVFGDDWEDDY